MRRRREGEALRLSLHNPGAPRPPRASGSLQQLPPPGEQRRSPAPFHRGDCGARLGAPTRQNAAEPTRVGIGRGAAGGGEGISQGKGGAMGLWLPRVPAPAWGVPEDPPMCSAPGRAFGC